MRRLLVLGGGTAGTMVVNTLRKRLAADEWSSTVVDRDDDHRYQPGYLSVPFDPASAGELTRPRRQCYADGVGFAIWPFVATAVVCEREKKP